MVHNSAQAKLYEFIEADKLKSVYNINEIWDKPNKVYHHFLENDDEVLYIIEDGKLFGLISRGDMYRYYRNEEETLPINRKFSYVKEPSDYAGAEVFFQRVKTIHEVPVIDSNFEWGGVLRKKSNEIAVSKQNLSEKLKFERMTSWRKEKFKQFNAMANMDVLYYDMRQVNDFFTQKQQQVLKKRRATASSTLERFNKMTTAEKKYFVGNSYHKKYVECFSEDFKQAKLCQKNGVYKYGDCSNESFHILNGYRQISNAPHNAKRKIWLFGLCTIFGHYVRDNETVAYFLQSFLLENGYDNYEVINAGTTAMEYGRWWIEKISPDDIVVIVNNFVPMFNQWGEEKEEAVQQVFGSRYKGNLGKLCKELEHPIGCIIDIIPHCNYLMNEKIAEKMFTDILLKLTIDNSNVAPRAALQNYFIPWDVIECYEEYMEKFDLHKEPDKRIGAIVMNCNPFTYGHRYLIEYACSQVDLLYVFVVEEDQSYFKFEDRLEMVMQGTKDLEKVKVLPSGKYIISKDTFAQYFAKDQIIFEVDDMDYDVRIFGEVVADMLGITCRFVGEEPFDKVTREYNKTMKHILPEYGIELIEIPRKVLDGNVISASNVRKYLEQGDLETASNLVPQSTIDVCRNYV